MALRTSQAFLVGGDVIAREDSVYRLDSPSRLGDIVPAEETGVVQQTATNYNPITTPTVPVQALGYTGLVGDAHPMPLEIAPNRLDSRMGQAAAGMDKQPFSLKQIPLWVFVLILLLLFFITAGTDIKVAGGV